MRISAIQNFNFRKIDPTLKKEIIAERKKLIKNQDELKCFENSIKYLEYTDDFELKDLLTKKVVINWNLLHPLYIPVLLNIL